MIVNRSEKATLFENINGSLPEIQFAEEEEKENANRLPFLDVHVQRSQDGALKTKVYRKPTHKSEVCRAGLGNFRLIVNFALGS